MLSIRGTPQLYYGDEIGMAGGDDPDNRRDFPGGFPGDSRSAFEARGRTPDEQRMYEWARDWIRLRREHSAIRRGNLIDLAYDDDIYLFARRNDEETIIIAINRAPVAKTVSISAGSLDVTDGGRLVPLLVVKESAAVSAGAVSLSLPAKSAVAYKVVS
jgi:glycosidase